MFYSGAWGTSLYSEFDTNKIIYFLIAVSRKHVAVAVQADGCIYIWFSVFSLFANNAGSAETAVLGSGLFERKATQFVSLHVFRMHLLQVRPPPRRVYLSLPKWHL